MDNLRKCIEVASRIRKADIVLKNPWIVDVFGQAIYRSDIAIAGHEIAGIGSYRGEMEIDCEGLFAAPAFIDAHVHVESSKVIPEVLSRVLIRKGVAACIADPHEIANVLGADGIRFMLESGRRSVMDMYFMMPSCVPAVDFEDNGAVLECSALGEFKHEEMVLGLGEVMDVPAVIGLKENMVKKLDLFKDMIIDGHCPRISSEWLNGYICAGIRTDHECSTPEQAAEEVKRGMYVMLREGSAARNMSGLMSAVNDWNFHRFLFCTDDKDISDIEKEGSIDHNIRTAIENGINPVMAYTIASLNAAQCYGLRGRGAAAPGYRADIVLLNSLENVDINLVIKDGMPYREAEYNCPEIMPGSSMNIGHTLEGMFKIRAESSSINVIQVIKDSIETRKVVREAVVSEGFVSGIKSDDAMKIGVFERHKNTGKYALGFIEGLGLYNCSVAQTIAHDSHNIVVVGDKDADMSAAVNRVIDMGGGIAIASYGSIIGELALPAAGLMACSEPAAVIEKMDRLNDIIKEHERITGINMFLKLGFMSLPVIPDIKITDRGLYDFHERRFISLFSQ
jgi:adenine deaminase